VNVALPAFAAERRAAGHLQLVRGPHGTQQQTCQQPVLLSIDGTDRRRSTVS